MHFNTKVRYGLRVMIEIALHNDDKEGVFQKDIAFRQGISYKYLDHIISALKIANLVVKKGPRKGYGLTKAPSDISLYDIEQAFEPAMLLQECIGNPELCERSGICQARYVWVALNDKILEFLKSLSLADIINTKVPLHQF